MGKIKVGVIFGGKSVEHEVSIISAIQAINKMDEDKYDVVPIYITKDGTWYSGAMLKDMDVYSDLSLIKKYAKKVALVERNNSFVLESRGLFKSVVSDIDVVFPIVHGTNVEDGTLQGYLQTVGVPYVGSSVYASVVGQDKVYMKAIWEKSGLPVPNYMWFYDSDYKDKKSDILDKIKKLGYPVIVKPATTGSSVGIGIANDESEIEELIDDAINYDCKILVERKIDNLREFNIAVIGNYSNCKTSEIEEVITHSKFLTFQDKYIGKSKGKMTGKALYNSGKTGSYKNRVLPAKINKDLKVEIEDIAVCAFKSLGTSGNSRIDFLYDDKEKKVYLNEINSIPGSLAFYLWEAKGIPYTSLLDDMINIAIKDFKKRNAKISSFESNILQNYSSKSLKGGAKTKFMK